MNKPNLFIIGFPKCGTSALHDMVCQHPQISPGVVKEPHLFSNDQRFANRFTPGHRYSYEQLFPAGNRWVIDSSTTYLLSPSALERIMLECPKSKFVIIARDPLSRMISHYNWLQTKGINLKSLKKELEREKTDTWSFDKNILGSFKFIWKSTQYGSQLQKLQQAVGAQNILIIYYEDFRKDYALQMERVVDFLALTPFLFSLAKVNVTGEKIQIGDGRSKIGALLPTGIKNYIKQVIWRFKEKELVLSDFKVIDQSLREEMEKWVNAGGKIDLWKSYQRYLQHYK